MPADSSASALPPHAQLVQMGTAHWVSHILYAAAKLGLADQLAHGPRTADELAGPTGTHGPSLYRLMRALAMLGVLNEEAGHRFSLTQLGEALEDGATGMARPTILTMAAPWMHQGMSELLYSVQTGKSAMEKQFGMPVFEWLAKHPEEASLFSQTMMGVHGSEPEAIAKAYDFSQFATIVDVGGATGHLLTTILATAPKSKGVLFDLPHVVKEAPALLASRNMADRVKIEGGSFFDTLPAGGDAYVLLHIIHDWSEDKCMTILGNARRAMSDRAKLLLIEMVLPPGNAPHPGKMLDIMMLVAPGGRERTESEYAELLKKAGLRLTRVVPSESPASVVEAERA